MRVSPVRRALLSLAVAGFAIGTGEFVMLGLLPNVADDLSVSIPKAGYLISAYALGVVVGAPLLTVVLVRMPRKQILITLMTAFAIANFASAAAPTYESLLAARFVSGLPHGAFFGAGSVVAANMVHASRRGAAMSVMFTGLTVANIVGVPATTMLGQHTSWRLVFAVVGVIGLLAAVSITIFVPTPRRETAPSLVMELRVFGKAQVWLALGIATLGGGGLFASFSYITPMMTNLAGYDQSSVTWLLVLFGLGMTVGNVYGARLADWSLSKALYIGLLCQIAVALLFLLTSHNKVSAAVTIFAFPAASLIMLPALQTRIIALADGAPNLAAASVQAAFNVANSIGAWLGGVVIAAGLGYNAPNAVAAGLTMAGLAFALASTLLYRRQNAQLDDSDTVHPVPA